MTDKSRTPAGYPEGRAATKSGAFASMGKWSASQADRPRPLIRSVEESLALAAARVQRPAPVEEAPVSAAVPAAESSAPRAQADAPKSKSFSEQVAAVLAGILVQEKDAPKEASKEAPKDAPKEAPKAAAPQPVHTPAASAPKAPIHFGSTQRKAPPPPPLPPAGASPASRIPASRADEPLPLAMRPVSASNKLNTREFVFTIEDYENIRRRIYDFAGIALASSKQDMVYGRLVKRLRERRLKTFREYLELIDRDGAEWEVFVNALTTNLTSFFREAHHFELLAHRLRMSQPLTRPFRIWCCAASTGEEPYSLAITACEAFGSLHPPVEIVASDINTQVLIDAREGVYSSDRMTGISEGRLRKFFQPMDGEHSSRWKVIPELQQMIRFCRINLLDANWPLQGHFDAIFCRNVMIYFDRETQRTILQRFLRVLEADGELYAGHSESFLHASDLFTSAGKTVYRITRKKK